MVGIRSIWAYEHMAIRAYEHMSIWHMGIWAYEI
jgi:hypothetical protein